MSKPYSKEQSAFKPNVKVSNAKPPKPIRKKSEKRTEEEKQYTKDRKLFLEVRMLCEVKGCKRRSEEVHHKAGRTGSLYMNQKYWLAVCPAHHAYIEVHPTWSKENGYSLDRTNL
jgi:hypothetical protein